MLTAPPPGERSQVGGLPTPTGATASGPPASCSPGKALSISLHCQRPSLGPCWFLWTLPTCVPSGVRGGLLVEEEEGVFLCPLVLWLES